MDSSPLDLVDDLLLLIQKQVRDFTSETGSAELNRLIKGVSDLLQLKLKLVEAEKSALSQLTLDQQVDRVVKWFREKLPQSHQDELITRLTCQKTIENSTESLSEK